MARRARAYYKIRSKKERGLYGKSMVARNTSWVLALAEMLKTILWCLIGLCLAFATAHALPILIVEPGTGKLLGADSVDVGGTLYDVRFVDGTCIAVFSGCDSVADFAFNSDAAAAHASAALLSQVFVDGVAGLYDSRPEDTNGCIIHEVCFAVTPFSTSLPDEVTASLAGNFSGVNDTVTEGSDKNDFDLGDASAFTFARWTRTESNAPLPGTVSCLGIGVLALVWANRRRAQARCRIH